MNHLTALTHIRIAGLVREAARWSQSSTCEHQILNYKLTKNIICGMFNKTGNTIFCSFIPPLEDLICTYILYIHKHMGNKKQNGSSGNASEFYSGCAQFKQWLTRPSIFVVFLRSIWETREYFLKLSHNRFTTKFPNLLFTSYLTIPQSNTRYW